jgi:hypothetical protein
MLSLLLVSVLSGEMPNELGKASGTLWTLDSPFNISEYPTIVRDRPFRILQLTDLHVHVTDMCSLNAFSVTEVLVNTVKPDLIIMTGDSVCSDMNEISAQTLVDYLDSFEVPYTFAFGNHDGEGERDDEALTHIYGSGAYSMFGRGPGDIHGFSNSAINLVNSSGHVIYSMVTIDSGRYRDYPSSGYDYIYPDQALWLEWFVKGVKEHVNPNAKAALFYHIPLIEMNQVEADMKKKDPAGAAFAFREGVWPAKQTAGFWDKVKELSLITHMAIGHDHKNMVDWVWEGVHWIYGMKTGRCASFCDDRVGGTLFTVGQDSSVKVEFVYKAEIGVSPRVWDFFANGKGKQWVQQVLRETKWEVPDPADPGRAAKRPIVEKESVEMAE